MSVQAAAALRPKRSFRRRLARFAAYCLLTVLILVSVSGIGFVTSIVHPPRLAIRSSPTHWGIASYEDVEFVTADGLTLRGWYVASQNGAAIILGHGHATNREAMLPYASLLARYGYGLLLFDWRSHGESDGSTVTLGNTEVQDFEAAFNYVASRPDVDPERIGALGMSMGASIMIEGTARNPRVKAAVIEAPYSSLEDLTRHRLGGRSILVLPAILIGELQTGSDVDLVRPVDEICAISPRPILLIFGENDTLLSPDTADQLFAAACDPKELWVVPGGGHVNTISLVYSEYEQRIITFFQNALGH